LARRRAIAAGAAYRGLGILAGLCALVLAAQVLTLSEFGVYVAATAFAQVVALVAGMQVETQIAASDDDTAALALAKGAWRLAGWTVGAGMVAAGILAVAGAGAGSALALCAACGGAAARPPVNAALGLATRLAKDNVAGFTMVAPSFARLLAPVAVMVTAATLDATALLAMEAVSVQIISILVWRLVTRAQAERGDVGNWDSRSVVRNGVPLLVATGSWFIMQRVGPIALSLIATSADAGRYQATVRPVEVAAELNAGVLLYLLPSLRLSARTSMTDLGTEYVAYIRSVAMLFLPWLCVLAVLSGFVTTLLFGPSAYAGFDTILIVVIGAAVNIALGPTGNTLIVLGRQRDLAVAGVAGILVTLATTSGLVALLGATGAAIGYTLGVVALNVMCLLRLREIAPNFPLTVWRAARDTTLTPLIILLSVGIALLFEVPLALAGIIAIGIATARTATTFRRLGATG